MQSESDFVMIRKSEIERLLTSISDKEQASKLSFPLTGDREYLGRATMAREIHFVLSDIIEKAEIHEKS